MSQRNILITGSSSGLGALLAARLRAAGNVVHEFDLALGHDVRRPAETFGPPPQDLDVLVNCAGINRTGWLEALAEATWDDVMDTNAKGIFMMARWAYEPLCVSRGTIVNVVSNASHVPMTCSAAYNASKGAAHTLTLQMARELTPKCGITVFGVSPNKLRGTAMSRDIERQVCRDRRWTPEYAAEYQRRALLTGEETDPDAVAAFIAYLLTDKDHHKYLSGCVLPYGA